MSVWVIGGNDPSGGAGLAADVRTLQSFGVHAKPIVTAVTAQSSSEGVDAGAVGSASLAAQIAAVSREGAPAAVKIGMIGSAANVRVLARALGTFEAPVVLDPVLASTSGLALADAATIDALRRELLPLVAVVTPNVPEASSLTGSYDVATSALRLLEMGARAVVVKGGHEGAFERELVHDHVFTRERQIRVSGSRHERSARGTGCAFASAVAAALSTSPGDGLFDAAVVARSYVSRGIRLARNNLLHHAPWPVSAEDFPWVGARNTPLPSTGPEPLGFYPVVDRAAWVERLVALGTRTVQLRVKDLEGSALSREIARAVAVCRPRGVRLFVNDFWQLAIEHGAYGVHLGQEDLDGLDLSPLRDAGLRLGVSTHGYFEAAVARSIAPSYVALGPIKPTTCKSMRFGPHGFARIREWRNLMPAPIVAIGGLTLDDVPEARRQGADGVAVVGDFFAAADPDARARAWLAATGVPA